MITLKFYTNKFMHNEALHMSVSVMVFNDDVVASCFGTNKYVTDDHTGEAALEANSTAYSLKRLLEALGHEVEIAPELGNYSDACDYLRGEFRK